MSWAVWCAGIAGVAGFALGVGAVSWRSPEVPDATGIAAAANAAEERAAGEESRMSVSERENARLREELVAVTAAWESAKTDVEAAALDDRLTFFEDFPREVHLSAFTENLTVTPEIAAALGIAQEEADAVAGALQTARKSLDAIEAEKLRIIEQDGERTVFEVPGYEEGAAVKDALEANVKEILGNRRGRIFLEKCRDRFSTEFSNFGGHSLTKVEILWKENGGKGQIKQTYEGPTGTMTSSGPFESLPKRYRNLLEVAE